MSTQQEQYDQSFFEEYQQQQHQQNTQTDTEATENALNQLFNPVTDDIPLDPTLASTIDAQQEQPERTSQDPEIGPETSEAGTKRKASSRADMLARGGACDFCKRRKLKCSAEIPSCAACLRSGKECVYSQKRQRSRVKLLEDKLVELERRLGQHRPGVSENEGSLPPLDPDAAFTEQVDPNLLETPSYHYGVPHINSTFNLPEYDVDHTAAEPESVVHKPAEPDLMTLADAAAGQDWPWEGMAPEAIARELIAAVEGTKGGLGDKMISHLLSVYRNAGTIFFLSALIPAETLISRLIGRSDPRPQPSLLLSVISWLLPYSPSPDLSSPAHCEIITTHLQIPARTHSMQAMSAPDGRLLDAAIGDALRAMACYRRARFLEGWGEGARAAALVWAAGLGKLGGIAEQFVGGRSEQDEIIQHERRLRTLFHKGQVIEPAQDADELGRRIEIFWHIFAQDQCAAIGWGWPSNFILEEITTPLPKASYGNPDDFKNSTTLNDFYDLSKNLPPNAGESDFCSFIKSQSLCYRACRLYDQSPSIATPEATEHLIAVAERHRQSMRPLPSHSHILPQVAIEHGMLSSSWMCLYASIAHLHAKAEMNRTVNDDDLPQTKCIEALSKVVEYLHYSYEGGDMELDGMNIGAQTAWFVAASLAYRINRRLVASSRAEEYSEIIAETKQIGDELAQACRIAGKKDKYGSTMAQLLENIAMGQDVKLGEWERPDNLA